MARVFIIHRWSGDPESDWLPWLKMELEKLGCKVTVPLMPNTDSPVISEWVNKISEIVDNPDSDTYFVGHSIGCQAILRYLEKIKNKIGGAVFVSGWFNLANLEDEEIEKIARPWIETPIDFRRIKIVLPKSILIISNNDPYGFFEKNKKMYSQIGSRIIIMHGAGHITSDDGYLKVPEILESIKELLV